VKSWQKLILSTILFALPLFGSVKTLDACCSSDTHCDYYTDGTFTDVCGSSDGCIDCTCTNLAEGCHTQYRWCQTYGQCGAAGGCFQCSGFQCWGAPCQ
jgi:hypothetical protein